MMLLGPHKMGCKLEILCQSVDSTRIHHVSKDALHCSSVSSEEQESALQLALSPQPSFKLYCGFLPTIHQSQNNSDWNKVLSFHPKMLKHNVRACVVVAVVVFVLFFFSVVKNTSWKSETCQKTLFSAQLYNMCCFLCKIERQIKNILSVLIISCVVLCVIFIYNKVLIFPNFLFSFQRQ